MPEQITDEKLSKIVKYIMLTLMLIEIIYFVIRDYRLIFHIGEYLNAVYALERLATYA